MFLFLVVSLLGCDGPLKTALPARFHYFEVSVNRDITFAEAVTQRGLGDGGTSVDELVMHYTVKGRGVSAREEIRLVQFHEGPWLIDEEVNTELAKHRLIRADTAQLLAFLEAHPEDTTRQIVTGDYYEVVESGETFRVYLGATYAFESRDHNLHVFGSRISGDRGPSRWVTEDVTFLVVPQK